MDGILKSFIVFEGLDGSGTTTQSERLEKYFLSSGIDTFLTREPTDDEIGILIRRILRKEFSVTPEALALLYSSDRHNHLYNPSSGIIKTIEEGRIVISDRYFYSSLAYQALQSDLKFIESINDFPHPQILVFIDTSVDCCMERIEKRGEKKEMFEKREFLAKVRENYLRVFENLPDGVNFIVTNGDKSAEEVERDIQNKIAFLLKNQFDERCL